MNKPLLLVALLLGALASTAACTPDIVNVPPPPTSDACSEHWECPPDYVCNAGVCAPGKCVQNVQDQCNTPTTPENLQRFCCEVWEFCNTLNECQSDPDAPVGSQCRVDDDCPGLGQFCSGGNCFATSGRDACTSSFQCPSDERCDRTVFLCVPDQGGCTFADQFPELACEANQLCDIETGFCVDPGGSECTAETVEEDCRPNQKCDALGRCVQCISDDDCGPGTACNAGTGSCISVLNQCTSDADCTNGRRCSPATSECVQPQCEESGDCDDAREQCDLNSFTCFLPPASCPDESDEPNDTAGTASSIDLAGYQGTLCRGNTDYLRFPVDPGKRYRATVRFNDFEQDGIGVSMRNTQGLVTQTATFDDSDDRVEVSGISADDEDGEFQLVIAGTGSDADEWSYTVTFEVTTAPQQVSCADETTEGIEPNDSFATAHVLTIPEGELEVSKAFARCGNSDVDYYKVAVPVLHGMDITVEMEADDGDLDISLYDELNGSSVDTSTTSADIETVSANEGASELWLRVALYSGDSGAATSQTYTVTAKKKPRPSTCSADINEPDGDIASAGALTLNQTVQVIRCNDQDADFFAVTVPANTGGNLRIDFTQSGGDLRLDLLDGDGNVLESANTSTSTNPFEVVPLPFSATEQTWYGRVRLNSGSGSTAQQYTISTSTFDASACTRSEPEPNDSFASGTCVGSPVVDPACSATTLTPPGTWPDLAACTSATSYTPGCASICGVGDPDYYRVGKLTGGQLLRAKLTHDPAAGAMSLALIKLNAAGAPVDVVPVLNDGDDAVLEANLVAPDVADAFVREYGVAVRPTGQGDFSAQPYAIEIEVGAPCTPDPNEPNSAPDEAKRLRTNPVAGSYNTTVSNATLCGGDEDVFEIFIFQGETLTATMTGLNGVDVSIGTRVFGDGDAPAEVVECGQGVPQGETPECGDGGNVDPSAYTSPMVATYEAPVSDYYYVTVARQPNGGIGPYTLGVAVAP